MTYHAVDCQAFAGGFTLGMVQAGYELVGKREMKGGFGVQNCEVNRHLLGDKWEAQAVDPAEWEPVPAHVVFGNPPCSGFSVMSAKDFRGMDSPVNACMHALVDYASKINPYVVVFESVQQAYTNGRPLMQALREALEVKTGHRWQLFHVLHNNSVLGGCSTRKRYFWLATRIPFGIDMPEVMEPITLRDAIGDLQNLDQTWELQPHVAPRSLWARRRRGAMLAIDGHVGRSHTTGARRLLDLMKGVPWNEGEYATLVVQRYYETYGHLPDSWNNPQKLIDNGFKLGYHQPTRWHYDKPARVATGGVLDMAIHPAVDRLLTHREVARIMGFPDDWRIRPLRGRSGLHMTWGKGISVDCGRWIGQAIRAALDGNPGEYTGVESGDRERTIDFTDYKKFRPELQKVRRIAA